MPSGSTKRDSRRGSRASFDDDSNGLQSEGSVHHSKTRSGAAAKSSDKKKDKKDKEKDKSTHHRQPSEDALSSASVSIASDAHMEGSRFKSTDVCPSCDQPRGSCVVCPVSHCHHGTDERVPVEIKKKKGGVTGLFNKLTRHSRTQSGAGSNSATSLPPLAPVDSGAAESPKKSKKHHDLVKERRPSTTKKNETDKTSADAAGEATTEAVQYYCYTDEAGNTVYYAAPSAPESPSAAAAASEAQQAAPQAYAGDADGNAATPIAHDEAPVCYQYVDEDGTTKYYYAYPQAQAQAPESAPQEEETKARSHGRHRTASSDVNSAGSSETDRTESREDEKEHHSERPTRRGSRLRNLFRKRRGSHAKLDSEDESGDGKNSRASSTDGKKSRSKKKEKRDAAAKGGGKDSKKNSGRHRRDASSVDTASEPSSDDDSENSDAAPPRTYHASSSSLDAGIAFRARELERTNGSDARKAFEKDLRKLVKELEQTEKSERHHLTRQRRIFVEDLGRQKRAIAFEMRYVEKRVQRAMDNGEPQ